jgi:hypothetical protein
MHCLKMEKLDFFTYIFEGVYQSETSQFAFLNQADCVFPKRKQIAEDLYSELSKSCPKRWII